MQNVEFNKSKSENTGIYSILLDNTHAILDGNLQINSKGFIYADNATKTIVNNLCTIDSNNDKSINHKVNTIINNSKYFINQNPHIIQQQISNNSFYNFPNAFPLTFQQIIPTEISLSSATGGRCLFYKRQNVENNGKNTRYSSFKPYIE